MSIDWITVAAQITRPAGIAKSTARQSTKRVRSMSDVYSVLRITVKDRPEAAEVLGGIAGVVAVRSRQEAPDGLLLECEQGRDLREEIFRAPVERDWVLLELSEEKTSLEDIFVRLTTSDEAPAGRPEEVPS